jgi:cell surface protein SprA
MPLVLFGQSDSLLFPFKDTYDPLDADEGKIHGKKPSSVKTEIEYDPETGNYNYKQSMGSLNYRPPSYMSFDEYNDYEKRKSMNDYWKEIRKDGEEDEESEDG